MRRRVERYRRLPPQPHEDYRLGCILLVQPFFLPEAKWIPQPRDWHANIVKGKGYEVTSVVGREIWEQVQEALSSTGHSPWETGVVEPSDRYGTPLLVRPRLGQRSFRVIVTDAYDRRCAVTGERTLPALEAAHIQPYGEGGEHRVDNGLLLRRDLHALFDRGYLTVTPDLHLEVSRRIREDFENGRDYYSLSRRPLLVPTASAMRPSPQFLKWHNEARYLG
jgi:putative restriction endonuclease